MQPQLINQCYCSYCRHELTFHERKADRGEWVGTCDKCKARTLQARATEKRANAIDHANRRTLP